MEKQPTNQLHQLLAVEKDRKMLATTIVAETRKTFTDKASHFDGIMKTYNPFDDDGDKQPAEIKEIVTTVSDKLRYTANAVIDAINAVLSKEETNSSGEANAELIVGKTNFGKFSATSFLALESLLVQIREYYKWIPTLDPTMAWIASKEDGEGIYRTGEQIAYRTAQVPKSMEISPATPQHKAQAQLIQVAVQVGKYSTTYKSGRITPAEKHNLLSKIDLMIDGIKIARSKANLAQVKQVELGTKIFDFIHS